MTINVISDLHCEYNFKRNEVVWFDFHPEKLKEADYLIVAGDTGYAPTEHLIIKELKRLTQGKFKNVLSIMGNHSYWVPYMEDNDESQYIPDAYFLSMIGNDKIDIVDGDVAIIGTTLWTNKTSYAELRNMNDYRYIPGFTSDVKKKRFEEESAWLREKYNQYREEGKKIVVVTHHNPRSPDILPENSGEHYDVASAYWVFEGLEDIKPDVWICGHIHEDLDIVDGGTRFFRHPIGYRFGYYTLWNKEKESWYDTIIEV